MRLVYVSQYFPPEMGAPAARVFECAREWVRVGLDVTVLTGMPHHPTGVVPERYRGRVYVREDVAGIDVCRAYVYATPNRGVCRRMWSYFTFMVCAVLTCLLGIRRPDVLVATSPQLLAGLAGWMMATVMRVPFVFEVRDLWPESVEAVGALRSRMILGPLYAVARFLYARARHIVLVSESSKEELAARGICASKMTVIKNGVDLEMFCPQGRENRVRREHRLGEAFVVAYIGTMGMAHGLEVMLEAAEELKDDAGVKFLLVGEGAEKEKLKRRGAHLENVVFVDGRPREEVPAYVAAADVCVVHLKRAELFKTVLPSKMFEIMGCERPILLGVEGEARRTLEDAGAGIAFQPEDSASLVAGIRRLRADRKMLDELGRSGRRFVERHYSRRALARNYAELLRGVA